MTNALKYTVGEIVQSHEYTPDRLIIFELIRRKNANSVIKTILFSGNILHRKKTANAAYLLSMKLDAMKANYDVHSA